MRYWMILCVTAILLLPIGRVAQAANGFFLHDGDRVCFYGDSITEQRYYPADVEAYILTRFPHLQVHFIDSGVGGDKVTGGWAGPIDQRLQRDVFPFKPNVVTIMLGMNDGHYHLLTPEILDTYKKGYEHIIASLKAHLPGVRIVVIIPSPFDDVTVKPGFPLHLPWTHPHTNTLDDSHGDYNDVLLKFGAFVKTLAAKDNLMCVDFNTPVVDVMKKMYKLNPALAGQIIPGRVHPSAAGHLLMAQALLEAWGAGAVVTDVQLNATGGKIVQSENTTISDLTNTGGTLSWTQTDGSLPMPIMDLYDRWPQFAPYITVSHNASQWHLSQWREPKPKISYTNPLTSMVLRESQFYDHLDREMLRVTGLAPGRYTLAIDGHIAGTFTATQWASGVNLAKLDTPMLQQAYRVLDLNWNRIQMQFFVWRRLDMPLQKIQGDLQLAAAAQNLETLMYQQLTAAQVMSQPRSHQFQFSRAVK